MQYEDVQVKCKKCQKMAPASEFTIDPYLKIAVCAKCAKESRAKPRAEYKDERKSEQKTEKDDFLFEKEIERIKAPIGVDQLMPQTGDIVNIKCNRCNHTIKYNRITERPVKCSFCGTPVKYKR